LSSKPKTRTGNKFPKAKDLTFKAKAKAKDLASEAEAKAKDLTFEAKAKAKDTIDWPRGASRPRPCPRGLQLWDGAGSAPSKSATGSEPWLEPRMWERGARLYID